MFADVFILGNKGHWRLATVCENKTTIGSDTIQGMVAVALADSLELLVSCTLRSINPVLVCIQKKKLFK